MKFMVRIPAYTKNKLVYPYVEILSCISQKKEKKKKKETLTENLWSIVNELD